jgi:hypothetical protein
LPWLEENFSMSKATAQRYLQVHKFLKNRTVRDLEAAKNLSASALYDLAGNEIDCFTPEAIQTIFDEAAEGKRVGSDRAWSILSQCKLDAKAAAEALERAETETKPQQEAGTENLFGLADAAAARWIESTAEQEAASDELEAADQPKPEAETSAAAKERIEHFRSAMILQADQAADLSVMFRASYQESPSSVTSETVEAVRRAHKEWADIAAMISALPLSGRAAA